MFLLFYYVNKYIGDDWSKYTETIITNIQKLYTYANVFFYL